MDRKTVCLGVTGGIAAYKSAALASQLKKAGFNVRVIMTENAMNFITPLTLEAITANPVVTDTFNREAPWEVEHVAIAKQADLFVIAPATANFIGKYALGIADDMLSTTIMATKATVLIAPAMNTVMYESEPVQRNIETLKARGVLFEGPESGSLACGDTGSGRMSEPEDIMKRILAIMSSGKLSGKRILVTAGPTAEPLDPVRYLTNRSSGKMGYAIAQAAREQGAEVVLVSGPVALEAPCGVEVIKVNTTIEMYDAVMQQMHEIDAVVGAAAPADYRPAQYQPSKIKKVGDISIDLTRNPDILKSLGADKGNTRIIAFAAETDQLLPNAIEKCRAKNADMLVANDVTMPGAGFGTDTNIVKFIYPDGTVRDLPKMSKLEVARCIIDELAKMFEKSPS